MVTLIVLIDVTKLDVSMQMENAMFIAIKKESLIVAMISRAYTKAGYATGKRIVPMELMNCLKYATILHVDQINFNVSIFVIVYQVIYIAMVK